jgi:hypothetical protein
MAVTPGRATTERPAMTNRLSAASSRTITFCTRPSISTPALPMPRRSSSTRTTSLPASSMVMVICWFAATCWKVSIPSSVPAWVKTSVKLPEGRPRRVNEPSAPTVALMSGSDCT